MAFAIKAPGPMLVPTAVSPYLWHPTPTAMAMATLDEVAPGCAAIAIGAGNPLFLQESGRAVERPVRAMRQFTEALRKLWAGEAVHVDGEFVSSRAHVWHSGRARQFRSTSLQWGRTCCDLRAASAMAWCCRRDCRPTSVRQSIALCAEGAAKDGRDLTAFRRAGYLFFGVSHDAREAVDAVRQKLAFVMRNKFLAANINASGIAVDQEAVIAAIARRDIAGAAALVPDEAVEAFGIAGTPRALHQAVARFHRGRNKRACSRPARQQRKLSACARCHARIRGIAFAGWRKTPPTRAAVRYAPQRHYDGDER